MFDTDISDPRFLTLVVLVFLMGLVGSLSTMHLL